MVNSLQQFVNNPSTTSNSNQSTSTNQAYYDPNNQLNYQSSYMQTDGSVLDPLRSVTPTKDELFQQIAAPPPPTAPYNHINYMVQPPQAYHQMYHTPTSPMGIPPLIDPNSYHPSFMPFNQPPPPIHGYPHYMPPPPSASIGQMPSTPQKSLPSPTNQTTPSKNQNESIKSNSKNNDQSNFKRKYGYEEDNNYNSNSNLNNKYQNNKNTNNRIPTINSQRDRGNSNISQSNNNNDMSYNNNNLNRNNSKSYHRY